MAVKKVSADESPHGAEGETCLVSGASIGMRLWKDEPPGESGPPRRRDYETVGYVLAGRADLHLEGQVVPLAPGDSWLVPKHADHSYVIHETFTAVEATAPPSAAERRDG